MSDERLERVLDAAYECFVRYGIRRTTMDDIAAAARISRPAVYQHVRNKDDAFRRLADRLFDRTLAAARAAATGDGTAGERFYRVLAVKLDLTVGLFRASPHAAELLGATDLIADRVAGFTADVEALAAGVLRDGGIEPAADLAAVAVALTRGLEADLTDTDLPYRRLRQGAELLVAGATRTHPGAKP
ncbi:MAG TPA: helix-turn-helix domain-containing protein [Micromonosporaceae bacterium]|nr:helix-turn-helix domain-containing protein [Micromonosporaceae bacterium]